jgi:hypothetical protein
MWLKYRKDKALQYLMMVVYFFLGWAVTTGPNTGIDVIAPGRQDMSLEDNNPVFRSADINCGTARFTLSVQSLGVTSFLLLRLSIRKK